ncbi:alcohol dehydrogenase catalytic domain-containing protein [Bacillus sp. JCM 19041]|uniref:alcohol dehydrogenase catalytic domain-containing protein n=1 Tax=Bacillus sp. JCM 19041 TaxID=1460637 RepID=UPI000A8983FB
MLIRVRAVGLCGSDIHYYEHGKIGPYVVKEPLILGHEVAGEIIEVGDVVTHFSIGQRVAVEPGQTCGTCRFCKSGRYNLCKDVLS